MAHDQEETLRAYIEQVLRLQRQRAKESLSDDELRQIAFEAGMTSDDLTYVQQKLNDYLNRGQGFIKYENWDGAIEELEQAIAIAPNNTLALSFLATAHLNRWRGTHNDSDKESAVRYAERCLEIDSTNDLSLQILSAIQKGDEPAAPPARTLREAPPEMQGAVKKRVMVSVALSAVIGLMGVGAAVFMTQSGEPLTVTSEPIVPGTPAPPRTPEAPEAPAPLPDAKKESSNRFARELMSFGREGIGPGMFTDARALAVDGSGNIYVGEYSSGRVQVFDPAGKFVTQWTIGENNYLKSMAADRKGTVYAVYDGQIYRYEGSTGKLLGKMSYAKGPGFIDVATTADGGLIASWDGHWRGGLLMNPESKNDLVRFDPSGRAVKTMKRAIAAAGGNFDMDTKVVTDGLGNIYALAGMNSAVFKFGPDGKFITRFGSRGNEPGQFSSPNAIAVDGKGRIYVSDFGGIQIFDTDGRYIGSIEHTGTGDALAINDKDELFVVSRRSVTKFGLTQ